MVDPVVKRKRFFHPSGGEMRTKQAEAAASDINAMMARFVSHGVVPATRSDGFYGDFSLNDDYHAAVERVRRAEADFGRLNAAVRDRCANDPGQLLEILADPKGREELLVLGLDPEWEPKASPPEVSKPVEEESPPS